MKMNLLQSMSICFVLPLCCLGLPVQADEDSTGEIQTLLFSWNSAADSVKSYDVYLDVVVNTLTEGKLVKAHEHQIRQRYQDGKWRVDLLRTLYRSVNGREEVWESNDDILAFASNRDGKGVAFFSSREHFGELKTPRGDSETRIKLLAPQLYETFKSHFYHETYYSMLSYRAESGTLSRQSDSIEVRLPRTTSSTPHNHSKEDFLVRFHPGVPIPVQIRRGVMLAESPNTISEFESEVAEVVDGIWVPVRVTRRVYSSDFATDMNTPACEELLIVDREQSRFNIDILPEVFELPFPPGTVVHDKSKGEN